MNSFAQLQAPALRIPSSVSDTLASWQVAGYSYLTSAQSRHEDLTGPTREVVLLATILTAVFLVGTCRRLRLGWTSSALVVLLSGLPAAVSLLRIMSASAAIATCWISLAAVAGLAAAQHRRGWRAWAALCAAAAALGIMTAGVAILSPLGIALSALGSRRLLGHASQLARILAGVGLAALVIAAFRATVWDPAAPVPDVPVVGIAGASVVLGGLVVAAGASVVTRLRPLAFGSVPILLASVWPGPAQLQALLLGLVLIAILIGCLLDNVLRQLRPSADSLVAALSLTVAVAVGMFILPLPEPAAATVIPGERVAAWLATQLSADTLVEVDPVTRAQLVRDGLDPARLRAPAESQGGADVVLAPLSERGGLPLIAVFGDGVRALGLRLVVSDPAAYAEAMLDDLSARIEYGTAMATNPNLSLGNVARRALIAGAVDARLMIALTAAAETAQFSIAQFSGTLGDVDSGSVLREATITDVSFTSQQRGAGRAPSSAVAELLRSATPGYRPLFVRQEGTTVTVRYPAPAPLGLLR